MYQILFVEDDPIIVRNLSELLEREGFGVTAASGQETALQAAEQGTFDLALLDISLTDGNGFGVCKALKERWDLPVIFLTATDDELSVVNGLDMGADDYIIKPFRPMEMISRIKTVLRRTGRAPAVFQLGDLRVDSIKGTVYKNNTEVYLSALEYRLLLVFLNNRGMVLSRSKLLESIWDIAGEFVNDNTLTVYIKRLREKIEDDPQEPKIIRTVRGIGYKVGD
ncbi:MAG: response regulator transcription factor [Oscillospiraceae bacterium]|nr:response regulator transcription factor [Oscillospiraceae bacterium]